MYPHHSMENYAQIHLQSQLKGATPHQLISMLFEGAYSAILKAKIFMANGNVAKRGEMISRAINIIDIGLRASLDYDKGKDIALQLDQLYEYMSRTLLQANLQNSVESLSHVAELLLNLSTTWKEIEPQKK
ncbi:flagellar protein FliS [Leclercia adecarboxylata]|nr:flagellar protein FliS [Leclercia adecarboxylata]KMN61751.1 flagellar protein FliS [Leclercia sp. LK8]